MVRDVHRGGTARRTKFALANKTALWAGPVLGVLTATAAAWAAPIPVTDVIPNAASAEIDQNSEPSLGVNPTDPTQMISGAFSSQFVCAFNCGTLSELDTVTTPYWKSTNGGTTWSSFGSLQSVDKSIAWEQSGGAALTTPLSFASASGTTQIQTFSGTTAGSNFGSAINTFNPGQSLDQPWIRTGPSGQTYVTYNNLSNGGGQTASLIVSSNNGATYGSQVTLEQGSPIGGQDAPSVRSAVNGSTVYATFTRWGTPTSDGNGTTFAGSQVVVVKSTDSGATFSSGVSAATTTGYFANASNTALTLGQERTGSDVAIAVDPGNANHVVVVYGDAAAGNAGGVLQLHVVESTDGGATWNNKFTTSASVRSALPAVSILANGAIGLLYLSYDPGANSLSQHLVTTANDFASTTDTLLGTQSNTFPAAEFFPYVGDFYDLTSVGNTLYGIFSASNADNGTLASFPDVNFQRDFVGTPGSSSFGLTDATGAPVAFSIDPFVFSTTITTGVPEPATLSLLGFGLIGLAGLRRRRNR